ncbi:hypothetical protein FRACA_370001 [Frankia canadensis]|uniref:Uncharacterized protein n=1 Tax=Frankia canadensis TaxID=1836972 RepID=A0A2I2KVP3_9ACTN|nr:hypothetical protein FRACA_370001 [Frankia canadensis]SOU57014.1 hypothetical protein FRACA_370001 [Frankia canadensis]
MWRGRHGLVSSSAAGYASDENDFRYVCQ